MEPLPAWFLQTCSDKHPDKALLNNLAALLLQQAIKQE